MDDKTTKLESPYTTTPSISGPIPSGNQGGDGRRPRHWPRVLIAAIAIIVVVFCAWSMSEYVHGRDPLAWLSSQQALQTTQEAANGSGDIQASSDSASSSVTKDDVEAAIEALTYNDVDVSVAADDFRVMLKANSGIWVEQVSFDGSQDMVDLTAERLSALCAWVQDNHVDAPRVTWIIEDANGYIRMIVATTPDHLGTQGSAVDILDAVDSYIISYDDYTSAVQDEGITQTKGDTPTYPDGNKADVAITEDEATQQEQAASGNSGSNSDVTQSSGSGDTSQAGTNGSTNSSSSQGGSISSGLQQVSSVSVSINGSAAGGGSSSTSVGYWDGMTAYDALAASGAGINARGTQFGTYVAAINGLAEKEHGSMSGWVYAVNGVEPNMACSNYRLSPGDVVTWTYVNVEY